MTENIKIDYGIEVEIVLDSKDEQIIDKVLRSHQLLLNLMLCIYIYLHL